MLRIDHMRWLDRLDFSMLEHYELSAIAWQSVLNYQVTYDHSENPIITFGLLVTYKNEVRGEIEGPESQKLRV